MAGDPVASFRIAGQRILREQVLEWEAFQANARAQLANADVARIAQQTSDAADRAEVRADIAALRAVLTASIEERLAQLPTAADGVAVEALVAEIAAVRSDFETRAGRIADRLEEMAAEAVAARAEAARAGAEALASVTATMIASNTALAASIQQLGERSAAATDALAAGALTEDSAREIAGMAVAAYAATAEAASAARIAELEATIQELRSSVDYRFDTVTTRGNIQAGELDELEARAGAQDAHIADLTAATKDAVAAAAEVAGRANEISEASQAGIAEVRTAVAEVRTLIAGEVERIDAAAQALGDSAASAADLRAVDERQTAAREQLSAAIDGRLAVVAAGVVEVRTLLTSEVERIDASAHEAAGTLGAAVADFQAADDRQTAAREALAGRLEWAAAEAEAATLAVRAFVDGQVARIDGETAALGERITATAAEIRKSIEDVDAAGEELAQRTSGALAELRAEGADKADLEQLREENRATWEAFRAGATEADAALARTIAQGQVDREADEARSRDLTEKLEALVDRTDALAVAVAGGGDRVAMVEERIDAVGAALGSLDDTLTARITADQIELVNVKTAASKAAERIEALGSRASADLARLAALADRIDAIGRDLATMDVNATAEAAGRDALGKRLDKRVDDVLVWLDEYEKGEAGLIARIEGLGVQVRELEVLVADSVRATVAEAIKGLALPTAVEAQAKAAVAALDVAGLVERMVAAGIAGIDREALRGAPGTLPVAGPWTDRVHYAGAVVTHAGGTWQARVDTGRSPAEGPEWICLASPGRDARGFRVKGTYSDGIAYELHDIVMRNGSSFVAKRDDPGDCPGDGWQIWAFPGKPGKPGDKVKGDPGPKPVSVELDDTWLVFGYDDATEVRVDLFPVLQLLKRP